MLKEKQAQAHAAWAACPKSARAKKKALADELTAINKAVRLAAQPLLLPQPQFVPKWVQIQRREPSMATDQWGNPLAWGDDG